MQNLQQKSDSQQQFEEKNIYPERQFAKQKKGVLIDNLMLDTKIRNNFSRATI